MSPLTSRYGRPNVGPSASFSSLGTGTVCEAGEIGGYIVVSVSFRSLEFFDNDDPRLEEAFNRMKKIPLPGKRSED